MIDGQIEPEFEEVRFKEGNSFPGVGPVIFSPDSQHVAYTGHSGENRWVVVVDGKVQRECVASYDLPFSSFSPDSQHFTYQAKRRPNQEFMVVDGKEGREFSYVGDPLFSPDSQHVAYAARTGGGKTVVLLDGQTGPEFEEVRAGSSRVKMPAFVSPSGLVFSPDSQHFAYSAKRGPNKWVMVVDGKEGPEFHDVRDPLFSKGSQHMAYWAQPSKDKWVMVLDGKPGPEFDVVGAWIPRVEPQFSPDGSHLAYRAERGPDKWVIVLDGQPSREFEGIVKGPFFSAVGNHLAYEVLQGEKNFVVLDGKAGPEYDAVLNPQAKSKESRAYVPKWVSGLAEIAFSPNGQHLSYIARRGQKFVMSQDGDTGPEFSFIVAGPLFSPDSEHTVYMGWDPNTISVVLDGKIAKKIPVPQGQPVYTQLGRDAEVHRTNAWDYASEEGASMVLLAPVLIGGEIFAGLGRKDVNFVEHVKFTSDGEHLAYVLGDGGHWFSGEGGPSRRAKRRLFVDGQEGRQYNADSLTNLTFSSDGKHFAYEVRNADRGKSFVVVDGQEGKPYDELLASEWRYGLDVRTVSTLRFEGENSITYLAREGRKFYRVTQTLP